MSQIFKKYRIPHFRKQSHSFMSKVKSARGGYFRNLSSLIKDMGLGDDLGPT